MGTVVITVVSLHYQLLVGWVSFTLGAPGGTASYPRDLKLAGMFGWTGTATEPTEGLGEQTTEIGDSAERGRRILLGWDGGRHSQRGRSPLEQAGHPPSAHTTAFTMSASDEKDMNSSNNVGCAQ